MLTQADRARIASLTAYDRDPSLLDLVTTHVEACMRELPKHVRVKSVHATTAPNTSTVQSVQVKLTSGGVIVVQVRQAYVTRSVTMLTGFEPAPPEEWFVYVVRCADGTLYCGNTNDVQRRVREHNTSAKGAKYTRGRRPVSLARYWRAGTRSEANKAELRFKKLTREQKEAVISAAHVTP
jgi:putative endonuclease